MEEYAITYENLILSTYVTEHILSLEMVKSVNEHTVIRLSAIIPEEYAEEYIYLTTPMTPVTLGYRNSGGDTEVLFRGTVTDIQVIRQGDVYCMQLCAKSNTYVMDIVKRYRTFQNTSMTVHQLIREIMSTYTNSDCIIRIPDKPIEKLIVQYRETDWEFLDRLVANYGAALIPDVVTDKIAFYVGVADQDKKYDADPYHYTVTKQMDQYMQVKENQWPDLSEIDFTEFQIQDYRIFQVGDGINLAGKALVVKTAIHILGDGILKNTYFLKRKEGLKGLAIYNSEIVGASITGQVVNVARDKIKVDLVIDQPGRAAYWFPYSTMSASPDGSGWYCMPEKGDQVRVYFPTHQESDAYAVSAVSGHQPAAGDSKDPMGNPNVKYLQTQNDQIMQFVEDGIIINAGSGQATIYLKNAGDLLVYGSQSVNVTAKENVAIMTQGDMLLAAKTSVTVKNSKGASLLLDEEGNIQLKGKKILSN